MNPAQKERILTIIDWTFRGVIAALFLAAALPKLMDPVGFAKSIENYKILMPIVGKDYINFAASFMPALELVTALALLWNKTKRAAAWIIAVMLVMFIVMVAQATLRGFNIDCGCFGSGIAGKALAQKTGWSKVVENTVLLAVALWIGRKKSRMNKYS